MEYAIELSSLAIHNKSRLEEIAHESGVEAKKCYQCGKCSAGCPVGFAMEHTPRQIMRFLQLSMVDQALNSQTIWLCASCQTCSERCPEKVDIAKVMESLRILAKKKGCIAEKKIDLFHELFLKSVESYGRVHEFGLILGSNILGMQPLKDAEYGLPMFRKGKISPLPHRINDNGEVKRIFEKVRKRGVKP